MKRKRYFEGERKAAQRDSAALLRLAKA